MKLGGRGIRSTNEKRFWRVVGGLGQLPSLILPPMFFGSPNFEHFFCFLSLDWIWEFFFFSSFPFEDNGFNG